MKKIGILFGKENSFPPAFVERVNSKAVKGVEAEFVKVEELIQGKPSGYAVIFDRISQDVPFYRAYLKNAALTGTAVINNPFWWSADEKFFNKNAVIQAVDKLERLGYINDVDYGTNFIRNRKYGRQRIIIELINRGLDRETISLAYETLESEEKEKNEEFKDIDDQKLEKAIKKAGKKEERKLIEYLLRQGFKLDRIFNKLKEMKENE